MKFTLPGTALVALLIAFVLTASACNTVEGIGRDTERAGEEIQDASK
jgi:predicted small secreted protein